jgi:hypothetical protein
MADDENTANTNGSKDKGTDGDENSPRVPLPKPTAELNRAHEKKSQDQNDENTS